MSNFRSNYAMFDGKEVTIDGRRYVLTEIPEPIPLPRPENPDGRMTVIEACAEFHVCYHTLLKYIKEGLLTAYRLGNRWVVYRDDVQTKLSKIKGKWAKSHTKHPTA